MKRLVEFTIAPAGTILVEVDDPTEEGGIALAASPGEVVTKASQSFETALDKIKVTASSVISKLKDIADSPDEISVEFGVKIGAEAGVILAAGSVEANYKINLKWKKQ